MNRSHDVLLMDKKCIADRRSPRVARRKTGDFWEKMNFACTGTGFGTSKNEG
jgi:hypothetical protein